MAQFKTKFQSKKQDWETPDEIFKPLDDEFHFALDVCATPENAKCHWYFTEKDDGLSQNWSKYKFWWCWMNPPFGNQGEWVKKVALENIYNGVRTVCLLPARTNTNWWHSFIWDETRHEPYLGVEVRFVKGRPKFKGAKYGLPQPLAIVIFRSLDKWREQ